MHISNISQATAPGVSVPGAEFYYRSCFIQNRKIKDFMFSKKCGTILGYIRDLCHTVAVAECEEA